MGAMMGLGERSQDKLTGGSVYILKSFNFGGGMSNWTSLLLSTSLCISPLIVHSSETEMLGWNRYTLIPPHIGVPSFVTDPTNQSVIYTVNGGCIAASYDTGDTWSQCWNQPPPPPSTDSAGFHKSAGDLPGCV